MAGRASGLYKTEWWGVGVVICSGERCRHAFVPADATAISKIQIGLTFLVLAHLGSPGKGAVKHVCVCVLLHAQTKQNLLSTCESF